MELRGQGNDIRAQGFASYSHQSSGGDRRKDGNHNGTTFTQTLDHHSHHIHRQPSLGEARSANSDRVTVTGTPITTISSGSNSKTASTVRYRECLRNHAASIGGNVYDGCGEFMPSGQEGTIEALKCAACECHRNFHLKEVDGETQFSPSSRRSAIHSIQLPPPLPSPTMQHHHPKYSMSLHHVNPSSGLVQPMNVVFGGSGGTESSSEELNVFHSNAEGVPAPPPFVLSKKRFRTKFTQDQKDKMMEFAEKLEWRIQKQDDEEVDKFCAAAGVRRQVFKVWMHNNKNNVKKQQQEAV